MCSYLLTPRIDPDKFISEQGNKFKDKCEPVSHIASSQYICSEMRIAMKNYRITISYDGTRYSGWQKQGNTENTIQGRIEHILSKWTKESIEIHGSGRTDAGVHALGQVANFKTKRNLPAEDILNHLNQYLPQDIRILTACETESRFHARLNASRKHYQYRIDNGSIANIFERKYLTRFTDRDYFYGLAEKQEKVYSFCPKTAIRTDNLIPPDQIRHIDYDLAIMRQAAEILIGEHDFKSFCDNKHMKKSTVRKIDQIHISEDASHVMTFDFYGNGFLYHMVRILTGTLLEVGIGLKKPEEMYTILQALSRTAAGFTAPPQGLFLMDVTYE